MRSGGRRCNTLVKMRQKWINQHKGLEEGGTSTSSNSRHSSLPADPKEPKHKHSYPQTTDPWELHPNES